MKKNQLVYLTLCAMFAALTAVLSQIAVPLPGLIPINLALIATFIAAGLLGWLHGTVSQIVFVLLGAIGLPVFTGGKSGIGAILGPTGGFIVGYILCALAIGLAADLLGRKWYVLAPAMILGLALCYTTGTLWFVFQQHTSVQAALTACVYPFLIGDAIKITLSTAFVTALYPIFKKLTKTQSDKKRSV
ncbi:MAG: biotin transporter BioY [Oscillospiraceae bacterium]|jgi:biotin transport system substrate-specific component|nr:biotin transporter BioY [Oscillospiraceae bacterium]